MAQDKINDIIFLNLDVEPLCINKNMILACFYALIKLCFLGFKKGIFPFSHRYWLCQ